MKTLRRATLALACAGALGAMANSAQAANWIMLQGTEPDDAPVAKWWGFAQMDYQKDMSDPNSVNPNGQGQFIPPKMLGPDLNSQSSFNVSRARIGVRGRLPGDVNYFVLTEFGNNAFTRTSNANGNTTGTGTTTSYSPGLSDASMTINQIPHLRLRFGAMKIPGFEEGLQAVHLSPFINFTEMGNQLMLERFPNHLYTSNAAATNPLVPDSLNRFSQPVGAFRDTGLMAFDAFRAGRWENTYAVMVGNGNGVGTSDIDSKKDTHWYLSTELLMGGRGPFRDGMKLFVWGEDGSRLLDQTNDGLHNPVRHDRKRKGVGTTYRNGNYRFSAEYVKGEGMIFVGPDKPTFDQNDPANSPARPAGGDGADGKASGWYVAGGWHIPGSNFEVALRYDLYNRLEEDLLESEWKTITAAVEYHFSPRARITANYAFRDVTSVNFPSINGSLPNPNNALETIGNRASLQLTATF